MNTTALTQNTSLAASLAFSRNEAQGDLSKKEIGYLMLMWTLLALNVMVITFINASFTHCM